MSNKLKVVWVCHVSNERIQKKLRLKKKVNELAPWITLGIYEINKRKDIEVHIVSPHKWISGNREFIEKNVYYHFFNSGIPFWGRPWPRLFRFDLFSKYFFYRLKIKQIIKKIGPNLVHFHGVENPIYSTSFFDLKDKYPYLVTIQGFVSLQLYTGKIDAERKNRIEIEKKILKSASNFGVRTLKMKDEILKYNEHAKFYWHEYFLNIPSNSKISNFKKYDLIFFAHISKSKGIEDLIIVLSLLKKSNPNIKLAVLGKGTPSYLKYLKELATKNNCLENIHFIGFVPTQKKVFDILESSKISVLPTYNDIIPGTIIESMFRKVPVVTYMTGGIPEINLNDKNVELVIKGDIDELYKRIDYLLNNNEYRNKMAERAYYYAKKRWDNKKSLRNLISIYNLILDSSSI